MSSQPFRVVYELPPVIRTDREQSRLAPDGIVDENPQRWVSLPIHFHKIWNAYKAHESHFWTAEDVDVADIGRELEQLPESLRDVFVVLLAHDCAAVFGSDSETENDLNGIGAFKLDKCAASSSITEDLQIPEARAFYGFQASYENILLELQSISLLAACGDDHERFGAMVDEASRSQLGVKRALLWQRHYWAKNEVSIDEPAPSLQERIISCGLLKMVQCLGHRILLQILQDRYPTLIGSSLDKVLRHTIETAERHTEFSAMIHKSFSEPFGKSQVQSLLNIVVQTEIDFLRNIAFKPVVSLYLEHHFDDLERNESNSLMATFGHGGSSNSISTAIGDGIVVAHKVIFVEGDEAVHKENEAATQGALEHGRSKAVDNGQEFDANAFTVQDDSDF